jgi:hypothetical protein
MKNKNKDEKNGINLLVGNGLQLKFLIVTCFVIKFHLYKISYKFGVPFSF